MTNPTILHTKTSLIPINASRMRQARIRQHLSLEEAAQRASINKMSLQRYESEDIRTMSKERLLRLAQLYKTTPAWLTGVSPSQEFWVDDCELLITPTSANHGSQLGKRLLSCLHQTSTKEHNT